MVLSRRDRYIHRMEHLQECSVLLRMTRDSYISYHSMRLVQIRGLERKVFHSAVSKTLITRFSRIQHHPGTPKTITRLGIFILDT